MTKENFSLNLYLPDEQATEALGGRLADSIRKNAQLVKDYGLNIRLNGDLGAGKTSLTRAFLRGLGYKRRVKSPTFSLVESYPLGDFQVNHFDFYRFEDPVEFDDSGFGEYYGSAQIAASEWTQKAEPFVPEADLTISLEIDGDGRMATLEALTDNGVKVLTELGNG